MARRGFASARAQVVGLIGLCLVAGSIVVGALAGEPKESLTIKWANNFLTIRGDHFPGKEIKINYLEAYCRPKCHDQDWGQTVIGHSTELVSASEDGKSIHLKCKLKDGVLVEHEITVENDEVVFQLTAHNPTKVPSQAHWAQPCIRVDQFTKKGKLDYIPLCFILLDGKITRLPTEPWAKEARYVPGQVYAARGIKGDDVNPRPLSSLVPSGGLCGCYSHDEKWIMATAWEPYQELFQGVVTCMHTDFRIGGLEPGETKKIHGAIYIVPADEEALMARYHKDFPEQAAEK